MNSINLYYYIKPAIPRRLQILTRRMVATHKRRIFEATWPINPKAGIKPDGWKGWPGNKRFALVLSHDVDTKKGLNNCLSLAQLERELGFRSSFNFVPERYFTPPDLRSRLKDEGFEIGLHGLNHDGTLFRSPRTFYKQAPRINHYLRDWQAAYFTAPSMLRDSELMADLNMDYACSTFDTDPFEPQSEGTTTIFPFFVSNRSGTRAFVELPYTLPQDHNLFIILRERDISIWREKLDWIVKAGGMVLLNTHPDYMSFDGNCAREEYPAAYYRELLEHIQAAYSDEYWLALPGEVARFWRSARPIVTSGKRADPDRAVIPAKKPAAKIWVDLDNTPHVPFFIPIIQELEKRGHTIQLTARDAFQVCDLAKANKLDFTKIGRHYGKQPVLKVLGLFRRSGQLYAFAKKYKPDIALSHGSRSQILLSRVLSIPSIFLGDYEHTKELPLGRPDWTLVPEAIQASRIGVRFTQVRHYPGIKEDVYVPTFDPDPSLLDELGLRGNDIIITVRPPADDAHYYRPESTELFLELMARITRESGVRSVLLPRNKHQEEGFRHEHPEWFESLKTIVPNKVVDGLNLLWHSDLVVSGGGTMNREAAALGVPVYSIFRGTKGAVDQMLENEGRLIMIRQKEEVWNRIRIERRTKELIPKNQVRPALSVILDHIENIIEIEAAERL